MIIIKQRQGIWNHHILSTHGWQTPSPHDFDNYVILIVYLILYRCFINDYALIMFLCWIYFLPYYGVTSSLFVFRILDPSATGIDTLSIRCQEFGHILTNQQLCSHDISTRSQKSVQTDPHYPMPARSNLLSTSHSGVGVTSSTNSQQPSTNVATAHENWSSKIPPTTCMERVWNALYRTGVSGCVVLVLSHITIVFSVSLWVQLEDLIYLMQHTIDWTICLTYSTIYQMHSDQWHGWVVYKLIPSYWLETTSDQS